MAWVSAECYKSHLAVITEDKENVARSTKSWTIFVKIIMSITIRLANDVQNIIDQFHGYK